MSEQDFRASFDAFARANGYVRGVSQGLMLRALKRRPDHVIDVGVRDGTPFLYRTFPDVPFTLVDPQKGGESLLQTKPNTYRFINKALGSAPGEMVLHEQGAMSTFLDRTELTSADTVESYSVEVTTLDLLVEDLGIEGRVGLKIDVEGYELNVVEGIDRCVSKLDFVVAEVSVLDRFENSYTFSDLVAAMNERGLRFYNIMNPARMMAPRYYDCLFLQASDPAFRG